MNLKDITILRKIVYVVRSLQDRFSYRKGRSNKVVSRGIRIHTKVQICGNGNTVCIEKGSVIKNTLIRIQGDNNTVILQPNSYVSGAELWVENNGCELVVGERTFVGHHSHLACTENGSKLHLGCDCMISSYVQIRTGDSHSLVDLEGKRINQAEPVFIGDHCWIGEGAKVLKGVCLAGDDIVSAGAIITKSFEKNVLIGGVPGRILKDSVNWKSERI